MIGLGLAASGHWPYAIKYNGEMAVANFNFAILMRNEIFGRLLYLFVNTLFAKVTSISIFVAHLSDENSQWTPLKFRLGCTSVLQVYRYYNVLKLPLTIRTAPWRHSLGLLCLWYCLAHLEGCDGVQEPPVRTPNCTHPWSSHERCGLPHRMLCDPLGPQHSPQVSSTGRKERPQADRFLQRL